MIDYIQKLMDIKDVGRYAEHHQIFHESVADHSFMVTLLAINLIKEENLDFLDFKKVVQFALYHDICEIGLKSDFDAVATSKCLGMQTEKKKYETKIIKDISDEFGKTELLDIFEEYEKQECDEAKFVKAVDKLETNIYEIKKGAKFFDDPDFIAKYCDKSVSNFPLLLPFLRKLKAEMKKEYLACGYEWKSEYDLI